MAAAKGFLAHKTLKGALASATLIVCATGNKSLSGGNFEFVNAGTVIASVTSADDELDMSYLEQAYTKSDVSEHLAKYERSDGHHMMFVSNGNAANFVHGAVIGPAIQLIEGEKLAAVSKLISGSKLPAPPYSGPPYYDLDRVARDKVATVWNAHFLEV
jgi:adenosylhomocysteinase